MQREPIISTGIPVHWKKKSFHAALLLGYSFLIYLLSSWAGQNSQPLFENQDKIEHILAYGFMAYIAWTALRQWTVLRRCWLWAWVYAVGYGLTDEWHQLFVPGRYADLWDLVADAVGAALAIALLELYRARRESRIWMILPRFSRLSLP
ncbi:MAG: VanZ family protein [Magnetococcales bacterium]|nr:VanZ family protein [Magnetococcales bacterium]